MPRAITTSAYHVPTGVGTFFLEASELASVVNGDEQLPDEQQDETDEDDATDHSEDDREHVHRLCTPCVHDKLADVTHTHTHPVFAIIVTIITAKEK